MLSRINKNTVKAKLRRGEKWEGYLAPSNVNSFHIISGWSLGCYVEVSTIEELNEYINNFAYYNCNSELGKRVVLWETSPKSEPLRH